MDNSRGSPVPLELAQGKLSNKFVRRLLKIQHLGGFVWWVSLDKSQLKRIKITCSTLLSEVFDKLRARLRCNTLGIFLLTIVNTSEDLLSLSHHASGHTINPLGLQNNHLVRSACIEQGSPATTSTTSSTGSRIQTDVLLDWTPGASTGWPGGEEEGRCREPLPVQGS